MLYRLRFIPALAVAFYLLSFSLFSQPLPDDEGMLFFPPKLMVTAAATDDLRPSTSSDDDNGGTISMRQYESRQTELLLPALFFEGAGSTTIPDRYQTFFSAMEADDYTDSSDVGELPDGNDRPKYRQILNIIGYRMNLFPQSRIELQGGYSALPGETEEVGKTREEVVRDYLTTIWHIEPERIALAPPRRACDSAANILRQQEAQRVMISTSNPELLRPVTYYIVRSRENLVSFNIVLDPAMDPAEVLGIEFAVSLGDEVVSSTEIPGHPDSTLYRLQGIWPAFQLHKNKNESLVVQAFVRTAQGTVRATNAVRFVLNFNPRYPREYDPINPFFSNYFSLPFFNWRDSSITGLHQYYLQEYIKAYEASAPEREGQRYKLFVSGSGDLAENMEVDEATITNTTMFETTRAIAIKKLTAPQSRFPMVFFAGEKELEPMTVLRAWLGDEYVSMVEEEQKRDVTEERVDVSDTELNPYKNFDSTLTNIVAGRGRLVANYLREHIESDMLDSIEISEESYPPYSYWLSPEERYYGRTVSLSLQPIYEYTDEYYPEDGTYDYNSEDEEYSIPEDEYRNSEEVEIEGEE